MIMLRYTFRVFLMLVLFSPFAADLVEAGILNQLFSGKRGEEKKLTEDRRTPQDNPLLRWLEMTPAQRQMLRDKYRAFKGMPFEAQSELQRRYLFFKSLTPEQQDILKKKYLFYRNLDPFKRAQIHRLHTIWQKAPNAQQQNIILQVERVRNLPAVERERELSRSVIWQVFSPPERKSLGGFMTHIQIQIFPFLPSPDREKKQPAQGQENQELP